MGGRALAAIPATFDASSPNPPVATIVGTSLAVALNGTPLAGGLTVPASTQTPFFFGQIAGPVGSGVFNEVKVTSH